MLGFFYQIISLLNIEFFLLYHSSQLKCSQEIDGDKKLFGRNLTQEN